MSLVKLVTDGDTLLRRMKEKERLAPLIPRTLITHSVASSRDFKDSRKRNWSISISTFKGNRYFLFLNFFKHFLNIAEGLKKQRIFHN